MHVYVCARTEMHTHAHNLSKLFWQVLGTQLWNTTLLV